MPKVPVQSGPSVSLNPSPAPTARASARAVNPFAEALGEIQTQLSEAYERKVRAESADALVQYEREVQQLLYSPEGGYAYRKGKAAVEGFEDVRYRLRDLRKTYAEKITDESAREAYLRASAAHELRAEKALMTHVSKESRVYQQEVLSAEIENTAANAALSYADPIEFARERLRGEQAVIEALNLNGLSGDPDIVKSRLRDYRDGFFTSAVSSAIGVGDVAGAERILKEGRKAMSRSAYSKALSAVQRAKKEAAHAVAADRARAAVDRVFDPDNKSQLDMENSLRSELSGQALKSALSDLRARLGAWDRDRTREKDRRFRSALDSVYAGVDPDALPPSATEMLSAREMDFLRNKYRSLSSGETLTDPVADARALRDFNALRDDEKLAVSATDFVAKYGASRKAAAEIIEAQSKIEEGRPSKETKAIDAALGHPLVKSVVESVVYPSVGIPKAKRSRDPEDVGRVDRVVRRLVAGELMAMSEDGLDERDYQSLALRLARLTKEELDGELLIETITPEEVAAIQRAADLAAGGPVWLSIDEIVRRYKKMKGLD